MFMHFVKGQEEHTDKVFQYAYMSWANIRLTLPFCHINFMPRAQPLMLHEKGSTNNTQIIPSSS